MLAGYRKYKKGPNGTRVFRFFFLAPVRFPFLEHLRNHLRVLCGDVRVFARIIN
jgi:hypothetical protein